MLKLTWDQVAVLYQLPVVGFIVVASTLVSRYTRGKLPWLIIVGWSANAAYLCWHLFGGQLVELDPRQLAFIDRLLSFAASISWMTGSWSAVETKWTWHKYLAAALLCSALVSLIVRYTSSTPIGYPVLLEAPVVLFETYSLVLLATAYSRLITDAGFSVAERPSPEGDVAESRSRTLVRLLVVGVILYAAVQFFQLFVGSPTDPTHQWAQFAGFWGGLISKVFVATGLFALFLVSSQLIEVERSKLEHTRNLLGRLSHESFTPLSTMGINIRLAFAAIQDRRPVQPILEEVESLHQRLYVIIAAAEAEVEESKHRALLSTDDVTSLSRTANANVLVERALVGVKQTRKNESKDVDWYISYSGNCCVRGNAPELIQVLTNLLRNALDALNGNPAGVPREIRVHTRNLRNRGSDGKSQFVEIAVIDSGEGISDSVRPMIFVEGFSTRRGRNRGRGLSIVGELVQKNGGELEVNSPAWPAPPNQPTRGTKMTITFPRASCREI